MITRIQARNFRCLRDVDVPLSSFQILVGANGAGKSSLLDVIGFLRDFVKGGPDEAIRNHGAFHDLVWKGEGEWFELAVDVAIPEGLFAEHKLPTSCVGLRYDVRVEYGREVNLVTIARERLLLLVTEPIEDEIPLLERNPATGDGHYYTWPEWDHNPSLTLRLTAKTGEVYSVLGSTPRDYERFGIALWFAEHLAQATRTIELIDAVLSAASPRGLGTQLLGDGGNMPWVVDAFRSAHPDHYGDWIAHLQIALPDLHDLIVQELPDRREKYLTLVYTSGVRVPSWSASAGTLRLIALTLLTYLPEFKGVYMVEEPENGVHPLALEAIYQSLNSVYDGQVLVTTHSPLLLSLAKPKDVLCFVRNADGSTSIIRGDKHPALQDWKMDVSLGMLFAGGVFG